jgi:hypothetical protein
VSEPPPEPGYPDEEITDLRRKDLDIPAVAIDYYTDIADVMTWKQQRHDPVLAARRRWSP